MPPLVYNQFERKQQMLNYEFINIKNIKRLSSYPYFIKDMSEGNSYLLDFANLTEWVIYAGDTVIKPNNLYMFIGE